MKLRSAAARVLRLLLAVPWVACTYFVSRGSDLYYQGRYIEAAQVLEQTEYRLASSEAPDPCRYTSAATSTYCRCNTRPNGWRSHHSKRAP